MKVIKEAIAGTLESSEIHELEAHVERIEKACGRPVGGTKLMAAVESALGVVNAVAIATAQRMVTKTATAASVSLE
jgi:citrate lyase subunit beta / citryl-CoA lyase